MKICPKCQIEKPLDLFSPRTVERGWTYPCKRCLADARARYRNENRAHVRSAQRDAYWKIRLDALEALGGRCVRCGFDDLRALQIDHILGGGTKEHRTIGNSAVYRKVLAGEPGYQCLCANCNWIKRAENNENFSLTRPGKEIP